MPPKKPPATAPSGGDGVGDLPTGPYPGQPEGDIPRPATVANTPGQTTGDLGSKQEGKKEEEGEKQLPNMSQCDTLIGSLDAQVNRLHQRHAMCTKQMAEDKQEMDWIDGELAYFKNQLKLLNEKLELERKQFKSTDDCVESSNRIAFDARHEQERLVKETLGKIKQLRVKEYNNTPKGIAYRSPFGILPKEIRPGVASTTHVPAPFAAGRKPKPGTKSLYRKAGGLD